MFVIVKIVKVWILNRLINGKTNHHALGFSFFTNFDLAKHFLQAK
jgi:hypothetical protein